MTTDCIDDPRPRTDRKASWLSLGFEDLVHSIGVTAAHATGSISNPFDVLIVGSGYGGAIAAAELAGTRKAPDAKSPGRAITVCVLERGTEYLPGMFPGAADELAGHVRFSTSRAPVPAGRLEGLFDIRLGPDVNAVVANGLGGGSLINAGVMLQPTREVLDSHLLLRGLGPYFDRAKRALGPNAYPRGTEPLKAQALERLWPIKYEPLPITVGMPGRVTPGPLAPTSANVRLEHCRECGDCATGCNFGAKNSLDINLLVEAAHKGAAIYTGATVMRIERDNRTGRADTDEDDGKGWIVHAVPTDRALRMRHGEPLKIYARKLVLAAGTFGSTEILLRSRTDKLKFSDQLGRQFSTNGDMLAVVHGQYREANAIADEGDAPGTRKIGPTITSMIDLRKYPGSAYAIQEIAVPGPLRRFFEEMFTTALTLDKLGESDEELHSPLDQETDPCSVDREAMKRTTIVAMMGDDGAQGALELIGDASEASGDGAILVRWPQLRGGSGVTPNDSLFDRQMAVLEELVRSSYTGGRVLPNPVWRLLPRKMSFLVDEARGPPLTVHPLGGCAMAMSRAEGVVNTYGFVFDASRQSDDEIFRDLLVLDGAIVPRALGINPALTIAALAFRATEALKVQWRLGPAQAPALDPRTRPWFQDKPYASKPESKITIVERLSGEVLATLPGEVEPHRRVVELTIQYQKSPLSKFMRGLQRNVAVDPSCSTFRVFDKCAYDACLRPDPDGVPMETRLDDAAVLRGELTGSLRFFHRGYSTPMCRRARALGGWWWNRGFRDTWDFIRNQVREIGVKKGSADSMMERARGAWALASRAGERRLFEYNLRADADPAREIYGFKELTYGFRANLWEQLETLHLVRFLGAPAEGDLGVDLKYFSAEKTPLIRVEEQHDLVTSMIDLVSFGALITRMMVNIHAWSFRRPDDNRPRMPQRLPCDIQRSWLLEFLKFRTPLPRPRIYEIVVDRLPDSTPVMIRLTRYARFDAAAAKWRPTLLIHGYSASGTTFAHTAVRPNFAEELWNRGRDVWIVDLRTSAGMPTATLPWSFEDAALVDIPAAIEFIRRETGRAKVDVVAHCMGAAMLSMAVLKKPERGDAFFDVRESLPRSLGRVVLSQVGPVVQFTPINVLRADVMKYIRRYVAGATYDFRVKDSPSLAEQLLDRFLSSLRYPVEERRIENPLRAWIKTQFAGTRHRIDALYGRAFSLANVSREVLDNIDDFFGPLSLETVSQGMHLAKEAVLTDRAGRNVYVNRKARDERWVFPTLSIHGKDNGMVDVMTQARIHDYFNRTESASRPLARKRIEQEVYPGVGHQDSFIGKRGVTAPIFDRIIDFLEVRDRPLKVPNPKHPWLIAVPWIGPNRGPRAPAATQLRLSAATNRKYGDAVMVVCVAVRKGEHCFVPVKIDSGYGAKDSMYLFNARCDKDGWLAVDVTPNLLASPAEGFLFLLVHDQPAGMAAREKALTELRRQLELSTALGAVPLNLPAFAASLGILGATRPAAPALVPFPVDLFIALARAMLALAVPRDIRKQVKKTLLEHKREFFEPTFIATPRPQTGKTARVAQILVGSCQYPNGLLDSRPAWLGYKRLESVVAASPQIPADHKLLLLVGDQIYSDATAGFADPSLPDERYRRTHEALFSRDEVKRVLLNVPTAMMIDDHEISDNWEPTCDDPRPRETIRAGVDAYKDFQRRAGPAFRPPCDDSPDPLWFKHEIGEVKLFVADTRSERRVRNAAASEQARIMSPCQHAELKEWLWQLQNDKTTADAPKFVASPSILLPRKLEWEMTSLAGGVTPPRASMGRTLRSDSWQGYPWSMGMLLHHIVDEGIRNVVFLSGDEHLFCLARARVSSLDGKRSEVIHSIHSSPLYAPFSFANAARPDFRWRDRYVFEAPAGGPGYRCRVASIFPRIDSGFAEVLASNSTTAGTWTVKVRFHDAAAKSATRWYAL